MEPNEIVTRTAITRMEPGNLVRATTRSNVDQVLVDAQANLDAIAQVTQGQSFTLLVDMRQIKSQDREAREHYIHKMTPGLRATAILIGSPMSRIIGNLFLGFSRGSVPTKIFTSEDEALAWLRTM
ncbi:MAG: STAS/SEC14 domain-containing protein [Oscillochloris sp.]|nr:STAS/SEC14 domain-containing protein [Oscillochloris sp.]